MSDLTALRRSTLAILTLACVAMAHSVFAAPAGKALILYEPGPTEPLSALGDARQLRQLMGHFRVEPTLLAADVVKPGQLAGYDVTFWLGFSRTPRVPQALIDHLSAADRRVVLIGTGLEGLARHIDLPARFGFEFLRFEPRSPFDTVESGGNRFTKSEPNMQIVKVKDPARCALVATASASSRRGLTTPYILRSGALWVVADSPFSYATESDRYLLFADLLHDILDQDHPRSHSALIRIEDTNPFSNPKQLRAIADLLSARKVPFLVGVTPFYVNPTTGLRVPLSEKPDYVDALRYMVERGGPIVMHGTTHQYRGETTSDYEFWDESRNRPLPDDAREGIARRLRESVTECARNGIYPLLWETPHYSAAAADYAIIAQHFSSAIEQRMVLDRLDYSQYFPYVIERDTYGQRIYPENLGYIPLDPSAEKEFAAAERLIGHAKTNLAVRDGYASCFFHPFVRLEVLERLVDGVRALGYEYIDLRQQSHRVTFADRAIAATGQHNITLTLPDQYLREETIDAAGEVVRREVSEQRISGGVTREVKLQPGWIYSAEPREFRERAVGFWEKTSKTIGDLYDAWFGGKKPYQPADILYLYDPKAEAGAKNDQESLKAPFVALNVPIEEQPAAEARRFANEDHNLLLVPYNAAELLSETQIAGIKQYVERGGQLVTDFRNPLAKALGVRFFETTTLVERVRDKLFPEESLRWKSGEVMYKFETHDSDLVLAAEEESNLSVAIARRIGQGRLIFFGTRFDPVSNGGFSRYPFLAQYVERICSLTPMLRREQVEVYFDPGYRHTVSIEVLAERWNQAGVRVLHVGGWHEYPRYTYDYERLIKRCHAAGILVYLWLEPPQVSQKFWMEHPEWREKNYKGEDVRASWRYPVALTEPACLAAVIAHYRKLLARYDWDGVNLAELYFEAGRGMKDPQLMTPMHPSARREFERRHGFDPALLFDANSSAYWPEDPAGLAAFVKYRVDKITEFHAAFLRLTDEFARQRPGFDVVVTVLDNLAAPELRAYIGIDTREIAALRKNHKFTLLVEDPESMWSLDPRRYEGIAARYQGLIDEADLALDLNILSFRAPKAITPFPTRVQTGAECAWLVNSAARGARRVVIYSESSVNPQDIMFLPAAYSAPARIDADENGWIIDTPHTLVLQLGSETDEVLMDGRTQKSIGAGRFLMTVGRHTVQAAGGGLNPLEMEMQASRLLSITGELLSLNSSRRSVKLTYRSAGRCLVTLAATPIAVFIDERETPFTVIAGNGRAGLFLPPGEHSALIITESRLSYGIDLTSFYSTNLIVLFGGLSVGLLIALYITVRVRSLASRSKP